VQHNNVSVLNKLLPQFLKTVSGIIISLLGWLIIVNLPMLDEISFPFAFTLTEMLSAAIFTIIVIMLITFGLRLELRFRYYATRFSNVGGVIRQVFFLGAILILYYFYRPLFIPYLSDLDWIFHLTFLVASLTVLVIMGIAIYKSLEQVTKPLPKKVRNKPLHISPLSCRSCGANIINSARFCPGCGKATETAQPKIEIDLR